VEFGVLGPVEARSQGRDLQLGGPKQRVLLAVLLLARDRAVSRDRLIDSLWGESPPATAAHTLDAYISRLRKAIGDDRLTRGAGGYSLWIARGELDLDRFEELVAKGRDCLVAGRAQDASASLRAALALWRGPALADILYEESVRQLAATLEAERLAAIEERIDADLACGRSSDLVAELESLVAENPFRERLLGQLLVALYRSGQQTRALEFYRQARHRLADELGLEPGHALRVLERQILSHDPALGQPTRSPPSIRARRRLLAAGVAVLAVVGALAAAAVLGLRSTPAPRASSVGNGMVELSEHASSVRASISLPGRPAALVAGFGSLWAADPGDATIERIDPTRRMITDRIALGGPPGVLAIGGGSVWAGTAYGGSVARIDPSTGSVTQAIGLGGGQLSALAFGNGALWIADATDRALLEVDPDTGTVRRKTLTLSVEPTAIAVAGGTLWVADYDDNTVTAVDAGHGNVLATVHVGTGPSALAATPGNIWVANTLDSTVSRINLARGAVTAVVPVPSGPVALLARRGRLWVASQYAGVVSRIDPRRAVVTATTTLGGSPAALDALNGRLWVATQTLSPRRGGTLRLVHSRSLITDPAVNADILPPASDALTRDGLVTFAHVPGPGGARLVPDLAITLPEPTDGGTTYTFLVRPGIRYSDGRPLHAADFRRAIEREFRVDGPVRDAFSGIVGATDCSTGHCDLSHGIVVNEAAHSVTFHLVKPDPDFLTNLTDAAAGAVPAGTPWARDSKPIPGTGPYKITAVRQHEIVWERNPFFHEWSHFAQPDGNPDRVVLRWGLSKQQEVRAIETGRADALASDNIPATMLPEIRARYAGRLHSSVIPTTDFFQFNTTVAPFDDVRVRRALNLAVNRQELVRLHGGELLASPTCQVLPPGELGYRHYCPYYRDLARARKLVAASGTRGERTTVWGTTDDPTITVAEVRYVAMVLRELGFHAGVRLVPHAFFEHTAPSVFRSIPILAASWGDTPYGFVSTWFACDGTYTHGMFCDRSIDRMNAHARALQATDPRRAGEIWAQIDHDLVNDAASLPTLNEHGLDFLSARVTGYESIPNWGMLADQLSITH
jgi:peptide/nickel transport system substrate-binding protein